MAAVDQIMHRRAEEDQQYNQHGGGNKIHRRNQLRRSGAQQLSRRKRYDRIGGRADSARQTEIYRLPRQRKIALQRIDRWLHRRLQRKHRHEQYIQQQRFFCHGAHAQRKRGDNPITDRQPRVQPDARFGKQRRQHRLKHRRQRVVQPQNYPDGAVGIAAVQQIQRCKAEHQRIGNPVKGLNYCIIGGNVPAHRIIASHRVIMLVLYHFCRRKDRRLTVNLRK